MTAAMMSPPATISRFPEGSGAAREDNRARPPRKEYVREGK